VAYLVTLHIDELRRIDADLTINQRFTKALPPGLVRAQTSVRKSH
jgi:hypothetical protein